MHFRQTGFTYLGGLVLLTVLAVSAAGAARWGALIEQRLREEALLIVGEELRTALATYSNTTPPNQNSQPETVEQLLKDPRAPHVRRHLRRIYEDPMTGQANWGEVRTADGKFILGFYSRSEAKPIKQVGFNQPFAHFQEAESYAGWVFSPHAPHVLGFRGPATDSEARLPKRNEL